MCGIAGYIGSRDINPEQIKQCVDIMDRRGPDATGLYRHSFTPDRNVCLIHSRLSIIDLDKRANQPFRVGSRALVCNGELYNYLELKQELATRGHSFATESDTEVLLRTIIQFGMQGLDKCEGMWAFAVYNENDGALLLSRDRFGEKPLYLYRDSTGLYFGSEVKFIFALIGHTLDINYEHLYRYLVNGYKSLYKVKDTFFQGIQELSPASSLRIDGSGTEIETRYWRPTFKQDESMTYDQAVEGVRDALIRSVELRLRADVPLAFCMSGGVDSNSLISIAKRALGYDVHGFTIANTDERYNEKELVNHSVEELGIRHMSIPVDTTDFLSRIRDLIRYHDAPVYTISYYAHWLLMKSIAEHGYKISISGTAADELLTGYYDHHNMYLYEVAHDPELFEDSLGNWQIHIAPIVRNPYLKNPKVFINSQDERRHIFLNRDKFASCLSVDFNEDFSEKRYVKGLLRNRMLNEMFNESVPVILHEDDLNAMYYSIENRSPFLDRNLFEFCYSIPTRHLILDGYNKKILRDSMQGIVPDKILTTRRKVGFNAPLYSFLDVKDKDVRSCLLNDSPIFRHVNKQKIENLLQKTNLPNSESKFLFYFASSKIFLEEFS